MGKNHGQSIGIEAKIEYHSALESLGFYYESWRRTALNWLQTGLTEAEVEKKLQREFNLQWAWADSIATEAKQTFDQLTTAKQLQIEQIKQRIKVKTKNAKQTLKILEKRIKKPSPYPPFAPHPPNPLSPQPPFQRGAKGGWRRGDDKTTKEILGLKSKVAKIISLEKKLSELEKTQRLHICFGSKKLFKAQYYKTENNYKSHLEWLQDWQKKRSGRFYCIGKSQAGGGTMIKAFPLDDDGKYKLIIQIPRPLQSNFGKTIELHFELSDRNNRARKGDFNYALNSLKPITTQVFRREHKNDQWYVHFTTYVQEISLIHTIKNGCLGLDFNKDHISATYVKPDGNIGNCLEFPFQWKGLTTGQRQALMRDIVKEIVLIAESYNCAIAIESLDFSKKKASMSEESSLYNEMLSNLSTALFRTTLESRCQGYGVELIKVNPVFTSVIGMIKFMAKYGLNSGTSAAMVIARRAMKCSEKVPPCLLKPEDFNKHIWSAWNRISRYIRDNFISRSQLFQWMKTLEGILTIQEHFPSLPVNMEMGESKNHSQSPRAMSSFV
jgi:IS605 OrfB family transposase